MITKEFLLSNLASAALHGALLVGAGAMAQYSVASAPTAMEISLLSAGGEQVSHRGVVPEARAPSEAVGQALACQTASLGRAEVRLAFFDRKMTSLPPEETPASPGRHFIPKGNSDVTSLQIGTPSQTHGACPQINPPPLYPRAARRQGIEGKVVLSVAINAAGKVDAVTIASSSGRPILDEAARSGVRRWIFAPARLLGVPISSQMEIPIIFQLKD